MSPFGDYTGSVDGTTMGYKAMYREYEQAASSSSSDLGGLGRLLLYYSPSYNERMEPDDDDDDLKRPEEIIHGHIQQFGRKA